MTPYYQTDNGVLYHGNAIDVLSGLPDESVNCCVTSPPYWGLRDYGVEGQLGLEKTPEEYVENIVKVFREVKRVLRDDGTLWLNLGDSYAANRSYQVPDNKHKDVGNHMAMQFDSGRGSDTATINTANQGRCAFRGNGIKPKDLIGIPWRVALALQADGWYLRQDIIWHKPNPMPESVTDRCTKAHEYIFLLSKSQRYYYDHEAVKEPNADPWRTNFVCGSRTNGENKDRNDNDMSQRSGEFVANGRNKRSVWTCSTKPFSGAHFAVFPPDLIEPCILAGCPKGGTVLDPFIGSGTTAIVSHQYDRKFTGIDLSKKYLDEITIPRVEGKTKQRKLF